MNNDLYRSAMEGIAGKIALQSIRKVIRDPGMGEAAKLHSIVAIVHDYEEDQEQAELAAERRATEADEAQMRREKIDEMFSDMAAPLDKLKIGGEKDG